MENKLVKVLTICGMGLSFAGTIITSIAGRKATTDTIAKQVAEALAKEAN